MNPSFQFTTTPCTLKDIENIFFQFRENKSWSQLISYLKSEQPKCVKTFNLTNTGHRYHALWAYNPISDKREKKQISLDERKIEQMHRVTNNNAKLYSEIRKSGIDDNTCPCETINEYLLEIKSFKNARGHKNFNQPPAKLTPNLMGNILKNFTINLLLDKKTKTKIVRPTKHSTFPAIIDIPLNMHVKYAGHSTIKQTCVHESSGNTIEIQNRAMDEMVNIYTTCSKCNEKYKIQ
ncbi:late expression factor 5 [Neodiprion abietis nucleopolyhedrovirus]|uniref:Late expression factor 5 n=1 Tax=Neodiprion abietis nucleopolyhedrovirus TaxID=204507 RepID=Q0ZP22_9CBAC|nr:late expression factor 5 [Neodiprion abietis nucleopolyhedrovirus]ABC74932.1 late expression factor 5 [Neodiprion abietis nucleopolyhedrovirus]